jgi:integrase
MDRFFPELVENRSKADSPPAAPTLAAPLPTPLFSTFAEQWFGEFKVGWRRTYVTTVRGILDRHLLPRFGPLAIGAISRAQVLELRSHLSSSRGRRPGSTLSPARINTVMLILRQILQEAADRYEFTMPMGRLKPLKVPKSDVDPFTLEQAQLIIDSVRKDYRNYMVTRFFTGMRSGEIHGLKWKYVDFDKRLILVREAIVGGEEEYTKTDSSQRDIVMSRLVFDALQAQRTATGDLQYVFCNRAGEPIDTNNFTKRVWYPLLRHLGLALRRPYQTRHTAATLWLAAGETPEWIARQLGHASTEMLFRVYSRFVPNLTRRDGSAFDRLLSNAFTGNAPEAPPPAGQPPPAPA